MAFLLDANIPYSAKHHLTIIGQAVQHVRDIGLESADDIIILEAAKQRQAVLITRDLDFSNIIQFPPQSHSGILVLRLSPTAVAADIIRAILHTVQTIDVHELQGVLAVTDGQRIRIRR